MKTQAEIVVLGDDAAQVADTFHRSPVPVD